VLYATLAWVRAFTPSMESLIDAHLHARRGSRN